MNEYLCKRFAAQHGLSLSPVTQHDPQLFDFCGQLVHFGDAVRIAARRVVKGRSVVFIRSVDQFATLAPIDPHRAEIELEHLTFL